MRFLQENECERYYEYNRRLLFENQENSLLEIRRCVEQAARDGKRVIIGGGTGLTA